MTTLELERIIRSAVKEEMKLQIEVMACRMKKEISLDLSEEDEKTRLESNISDILLELGIPTRIKGFLFTKEALLLCKENPIAVTDACKEIYPKVAQKYDEKPARIERNIRTAKERMYKKGNKQKIKEVFHSDEVLVNAEFLGRIIEYIEYLNK